MVYANENNKPIFDHVMSIFKAALDSSLKFYQIDKDIDEVDAQNTAACINEECDLSPR